ncbi:MAG TPA: serine/threonine-protein kinase [Kofleriaceae bacterium]
MEHYQLGPLLGKGGMGEVVLAEDLRLGRSVAIKRMRQASPNDEAVQRFLREATIQARLDHPAIVPVHEVGRDAEGRPFFTMKRLAGTTLHDVMVRGDATLQRLLRAVVEVCQAIDLAHARKIVHRDLKPANIMLGDYGEVYVLDWGVARVLDGHDDRPGRDIPSLGDDTLTGELLGTPGYMAPEQVLVNDVRTPADIYALGAILFEILAGETLHPRGQAALVTTISPLEASPAKRCPARAIPPELDALCVAALARSPEARPTARELGDRIQLYLDGDRDLDRRRVLAAELVAEGRAALAAGKPGEAVRLGGRALALDPASDPAGELVMSLVLSPPDEAPPEVIQLLAIEEKAARRDRSKRAIAPYLIPIALLPVLLFGSVGIGNWPALIGLYVVSLGLAALAWLNSRTGTVPVAVFLLAHLVMIAMFSRVSGPFVMTPMLIAGVALSVTSLPWLNDRPLALVGCIALAVLTPFALEDLGVFARSWEMTREGVLSTGTIFKSRESGVPIFVGNLAITIVVALYARAISRDRRTAQRRHHIQAWYFRQLLPRPAKLP